MEFNISDMTSESQSVGLAHVGLTVLFLVIYFFCLSPSITWEDSAAYLVRLLSTDGFVTAREGYRLYYLLLGVLSFPGVERLAFWANLQNALLSVVSLNIFLLILRELDVSPAVAVPTTVTLGVSHLFWHYAEVVKIYPLMILFLLSCAYFFVRGIRTRRVRDFLFAGLIYGVSWSIHPMNMGIIVAFLPVLLILTLDRWNLAVGFLLGLLVGIGITALLYFDVILDGGIFYCLEQLLTGGRGFYEGGEAAKVLQVNWSRLTVNVLEWFVYLGYQYLWLLPIGFLGVHTILREQPLQGTFLVVAYLAYAGVAFDHNVPLKINFYFSSFVFFGIFVGHGLEKLYSWQLTPTGIRFTMLVSVIVILSFPLIYFTVSHSILPALELDRFSKRPDSHYKNRIQFYLWPPKNSFSEATEFARHLIDLSSKHEKPVHFVLDWQERFVLKYVLLQKNVKAKISVDHWTKYNPNPEFYDYLEEHLSSKIVYVGVQYRSILEAQFQLQNQELVYRIQR